ncbi:P-loop containing nucleoside triphosphate hydrolase protein [Limtongia smithiae]|uniref:P-loop containing nucleoside triphosphate hydrolase protein n=1 Tax=Limtongia smithiae TaxID=1125753 RepID=UPI0034CE6D13
MTEQLPIQEVLLEHLSKNKVTILVGETGSGKSTRMVTCICDFKVPQLIRSLDAKHEIIAVTQPRRVAAINLAKRVAEEVGTELGQDVGYTVRFQNMSSQRTKIKFLTDGMLLRELLLQPELNKYTTIILDEAHERTVITDLLMGFLKDLLLHQRKNNLRLIVMSATLDAEKFSRFFEGAEVLYVQGRKFAVERLYLPRPVDDVVDAMVRTVVQINMSQPTGDILAFLAGQEDIDKAAELLEELASTMPKNVPQITVLPLYAALPPERQMAVFEHIPGFKRKVILATNIAETSLTISGVRYVIDGGLHKVKVWRHDLGLDSLLTIPIAKSNAAQRMGRAGREAAGKCYRLYTEADYHLLRNQNEPEIERCDVAFPLLTLKSAGVSDVMRWSWLERPSKGASMVSVFDKARRMRVILTYLVMSALTQLYALKALDDAGKITKFGRQMALLPLPPHLAAVLLRAHEQGIDDAVLDIVACLSIENLVMNPRPEKRDEVNDVRMPFISASGGMGDLIVLRNYVQHYRSLPSARERTEWCESVYINARAMANAEDARKQLERYIKTNIANGVAAIEPPESVSELNEKVVECFLSGFIANTAIAQPGKAFITIGTGQPINVHPSSSVFGRKVSAIMYTEYIFTTKAYARNVSPVDLESLQRLAPHFLNRRSAGEGDEN